MSGHVFISYSRRDREYVTGLADHLTRAGVRVWLDTDELAVGDRWEHVVRDRVDDCAAMIVVMSPAAEASPHVGNELQRARDQGKPILPVLLAGTAFFALGTSNYFDARAGQLPDRRFVDRLGGVAVPDGGARSLVVGDLPGEAVAWQERPGPVDELVRSAGLGGTAVIAALTGQRGVGKTQLAAAYARLRIRHGWPIVVWANAAGAAGIVTALDELATAAGRRRPEDDPVQAARAGLRWLRDHRGPCLLVYDNAVDADLIRAWTPPVGSVHTVVTTTVRALDALGELVDVDLFTAAEAGSYLRRRTRLDDDAGAAELAAHLGHLPLALAHAGAVIGAGRRYPTYRRYLAAAAGTSTAELLPRTAGDPYPFGLAEAILLSLDDLGRAEASGSARRLLDRLAVLAPVGADPVLLGHLVEGVDEAAAVLAGRSLAVAGDGERLVVHRLIQRVVRERAGSADRAVTGAATAIGAAAERVAERWEQRALLTEYAEHGQALLAHATGEGPRRQVVSLLVRLTHLLVKAFSLTHSVIVGAALAADAEAVLGADHPDTLALQHDLASAFQQIGRHVEAVVRFAATLAARERVLGPLHPDTLTSRHGLASAYRAAGEPHRSFALFTRTLVDRQRVLGTEHPDTIQTRNDLAGACASLGRREEAFALFGRTLAERERVLGPDHRDTIASRNNLAGAYEAMGRRDEGAALYGRALADAERVLGVGHPLTVAVRNNLACTYRELGRHDEAIELSTRVLADSENAFGPDHPHTLTSRNNLAGACQAARRYDRAIALLTDNLAACARVFGPDHPRTHGARTNLDSVRADAGKPR
ncbi:FxSxx-COOH system tetratricopeptide repeat protein [Paractinoplanes rishiriensis]|uniref:Tetratricopeptide repeat protein n=1 Tax=Paractinoplanes rishiriensis TaxID=1050105 RepID=A0A919K6Q3_9ACTN|nr:FxSxx-COOH system tetratricopeptide repeat protein [Actinoplanes rishiriensis]GIE99925.1 tetratricopeptide repeat protein [Actinoplanes rishiriensis]